MGQTSQVPGSMVDQQQVLFVILGALSLAQIMVVWTLRKKFYASTSNPGSIQALEDQLRGKHIILFALSEVPAIYGIIYFFLTSHLNGQIILTFFSWVCLAISKPSVRAIEELERRFGV